MDYDYTVANHAKHNKKRPCGDVSENAEEP